MRKVFEIALCIIIIIGSTTVLVSQAKRISKEPVKQYNVVLLTDALQLAFKGTHITTNGFCTTIWIGETADTTICAPHIVTEAAPAPEAEEAQDQHSKSKTRASL